MVSHSLKLRCTCTGCGHEILLPNGKTLVVDPYYPESTPGRTLEDVQGADYILLTHSHYDHDFHMGELARKFGSRVILPAGAALAEAKYQRLTYDSLYPAYPGSHFTFPDFTLDVFQAKHNTLGAARYDPEVDITRKFTGRPGDLDADCLGGIFSNDYLIRTNNGFSILIASGQIEWEEALSRYRQIRPNLLLRQSSVRPRGVDLFHGGQVDASELAKLFTSYNAQVLVPFHMDSMRKNWSQEELDRYFAEVAAEVRKLDPGAVFLAPQPWKWYSIGICVDPADE